MQKRIKRAFTLFELMICLAIIGLMSTLVATKGYQLLSYHQFRCVSQTFLFSLNQFQMLAMTRGSDIYCKMQKTPSGYRITWQSDAPIVGEAQRPSELKGVEKLQFQGKNYKDFEFTIFSSGRISSQGVLTLIPKKEDKALSIDLAYPVILQRGDAVFSCLKKSNTPHLPKIKKKKEQESSEAPKK